MKLQSEIEKKKCSEYPYFNGMEKVYIIAEIGVNHNGDIDLAKRMIFAAKKSGADAVKFQTFKSESLAHPSAPKVEYQKKTSLPSESHLEMLSKLELSWEAHRKLKKYCDELGIDFLSTPYDIESAQFLLGLGVKFFKTASADIVDLPLHGFIAKSGTPAIIATGMASLGEIERVVNIYLDHDNSNIILLHCVSNYPCSDESINLNSMKTMARAFNFPVGYSDHSVGSLAATISVAMGARIIEKHFTTNKLLPGPDQKASSTPQEFEELVKNIRKAELILGSSNKRCRDEELEMKKVSRKSLVYSENKEAGDIIGIEDLKLMRPGDGLDASYTDQVIGKSLKKSVKAGSQIHFADLEV